MKLPLTCALLTISSCLLLAAATPGMPEIIRLYPATPPSSATPANPAAPSPGTSVPTSSRPSPTSPAEAIKERGTAERTDRSITNVRDATITVYFPDPAIATGAAAIICPGGGYTTLAIDHEGHDIARWLNANGIAGIVLKYRLPRFEESAASSAGASTSASAGVSSGISASVSAEPLPLQDVHEAIRQTRAHATDHSWPIDPTRIGIVGFSAGGHLAAAAATHFTPETRPNFAILGYAVISMHADISHGGSRKALLGPSPSPEIEHLYSNEDQVTPQTPPTFLFHAKDDRTVPIANSERFAEACKKAGVPVELHEFDHGGHGFGLGKGESAAWPAQCITWLQTQGLLKH